jgi:hypothetical protein
MLQIVQYSTNTTHVVERIPEFQTDHAFVGNCCTEQLGRVAPWRQGVCEPSISPVQIGQIGQIGDQSVDFAQH